MESRTIIWPEGEPERAAFQRGPLHSWWLSMRYSLRGLRTCRAWYWSPDTSPVQVAREWERKLAGR